MVCRVSWSLTSLFSTNMAMVCRNYVTVTLLFYLLVDRKLALSNTMLQKKLAQCTLTASSVGVGLHANRVHFLLIHVYQYNTGLLATTLVVEIEQSRSGACVCPCVRTIHSELMTFSK